MAKWIQIKQYGTELKAVLNMDLAEAIYPSTDGKFTIVQFPPLGNGESNNWCIDETYETFGQRPDWNSR